MQNTVSNISEKVSDRLNFYAGQDPVELVRQYGSPLYVYSEAIFRRNCRRLKNLVSYPKFRVNYSTKANCCPALLQIARQEGLSVDAMSPGEIYVQMKAGFSSDEIFYVSNNVSEEEMQYALDRNILISVDSIAQLEQLGRLNPGGRVSIRMNPGVGLGHHEKVVTAGKDTKFGVNPEYIGQIKALIQQHNLKLVGLNQHLGSLFMEGDRYIEGITNLLSIAMQFDDLELIDFGGGFGIPYHKQDNEPELDLVTLGVKLGQVMHEFSREYGRELTFAIEPGRYIPCESGILLGSVHAVKYNSLTKYIGTDLGFNVLVRPAMYDSHHDIEVYREGTEVTGPEENVTIVGNICESGDILARNRKLPEILKGDVLGVLDAGAYGYSMCSNYNNRLRPAEVLIREDGSTVLIRERDTLEDLMRHCHLISI